MTPCRARASSQTSEHRSGRSRCSARASPLTAIRSRNVKVIEFAVADIIVVAPRSPPVASLSKATMLRVSIAAAVAAATATFVEVAVAASTSAHHEMLDAFS